MKKKRKVKQKNISIYTIHNITTLKSRRIFIYGICKMLINKRADCWGCDGSCGGGSGVHVPLCPMRLMWTGVTVLPPRDFLLRTTMLTRPPPLSTAFTACFRSLLVRSTSLIFNSQSFTLEEEEAAIRICDLETQWLANWPSL